MKKLLPVLACFFLIACKSEKKSVDLFKIAPQEATLLIHSSDIKGFYSTAKKLSFIAKNPTLFKELQNQLDFLNYTENTGETLLAFIKKEEKQNIFLLSRKPVKFDSTYFDASEKSKFKNREIQQFTTEGQNYFSAEKSGAYIFTASRKILEDYLETDREETDADLEKISKAADAGKTSIFINHKTTNKKLNPGFPGLSLAEFGSWSSVDVEIQEDEIHFNGLSLWDKNNGIQELFKDVGSSPQEIAQIVPGSATGFFSFGYLKFEVLRDNFLKSHQREFSDYQQEMLENSTEVASLQLQDKELLILNSLNPDNLQRIIEPYAKSSEEFRSIPIFEFTKPDIFAESLKPLIALDNLKFTARLDKFIVFSPSTEILKDVIRAYRNGETLNAKGYHQKAAANFSSRGNMLSVLLVNNLDQKTSNSSNNFSAGPYKMLALQVVTEQNFSHLHGVFQPDPGNTISNKPTQISSIKTEAEILGNPMFFYNHETGGQDIAVQDINNQLYLFSSEGNLHWKKQVNGPILGKIRAVDLYKNGNFQLAFATPNRLEVIDRRGKRVNPFPLKFKDEITQALALFDYDNNKNYRFLITQGNELFMYDGKGQIVRGFTFREAESDLTQAPKHIRMNNRDYIVFPKANGKLSILSRQGKTRVKVSESFNLEEGEWYGNEGYFIAVEKTGNLIKINHNGRVSRETLGLSEEFQLAATGNLRVSLSENKLQIREKELELDYGLYSKPQIFLINNKYYIALTDTQSEKVYVFDSKAEILPGLPVYGKSQVDMAADKNDRPLLLVKGDSDEVLVYTF